MAKTTDVIPGMTAKFTDIPCPVQSGAVGAVDVHINNGEIYLDIIIQTVSTFNKTMNSCNYSCRLSENHQISMQYIP